MNLDDVPLPNLSSYDAQPGSIEPTSPDFDYRELLEALLIVPWEADATTQTFTYVGPQAETLLGYPLHRWYERGFWVSTIHPEDRDRAVAFCVDQCNKMANHSFEYRMLDHNGRMIWILDVVRVHQSDGKLVLRGLMLDITERKRAEESLRQSEARLDACVRHTPHVAIQWFDQDGRVVFWNAASEVMFGYSEEEANGRTLDQLIHTPEEFRQFRTVLADIARTGKPVGPVEYSFRRRDGSSGICLSTMFDIPSPTGDPWFVCMDVDLTDRKRMEEQIRHAQKAESLGVLAGGVAHDFNNLLTSILGFASLAEMELPADAPARESIRQVMSAGQRAAELTQQLLAYAGKGKFLIQPVHLSWLIKDMGRLMQSGISKKVSLQLNLSEDLPPIEGDATQLRQMVMSLVANASDALHDQEGRIEVRTGFMEVHAARLAAQRSSTTAKPGNFVFVEVVDNGRGMDDATVTKIFDPFFSTKFTGRGLGLPAALGIVRSHHGFMEVESAPNLGSTFRVLLPATGEETTPPPTPKPTRAWRGSGTILMADDEAPIRTLSRMGLSRAGFEVVEAVDGQEAIDLFLARPQSFTAVLLDLVMPRRDGAEVLREIRRINQQVPVILISGYTEEEVQKLLDRENVAAFLHKPFTTTKLLDTLRDVLNPVAN